MKKVENKRKERREEREKSKKRRKKNHRKRDGDKCCFSLAAITVLGNTFLEYGLFEFTNFVI